MDAQPIAPYAAVPVHLMGTPAARRTYRRGETLLHAGDAGDVLRIERGLVKLVVPACDGRDRVLAVLGSGDLLGAEAALGGFATMADVVALGEVTVVARDRTAFVADLRGDPERAIAVARSVSRQLCTAWDDQARAYRTVRERLAALLLGLAIRFGEPGHDGRRVLSCGLNHHGLAALIGAQRASVSVAMAGFRRARAAVGARGTYTVDLARLQVLVGDATPVAGSRLDQRPTSRTTSPTTGSRSTVSSTSVVVKG